MSALSTIRVRYVAVGVAGLVIATPAKVAGQTVGVEPPSAIRTRIVRDTGLVNALNNFVLLGQGLPVKRSDLAIRVIAVAGESGSAKDGESDRVVHWLYVSVSEFGELPGQRLYRLGPLFNPKLDSLVAQDSVPTAFVSYGAPSKRQHARIAATLDSVQVTPVGAVSTPIPPDAPVVRGASGRRYPLVAFGPLQGQEGFRAWQVEFVAGTTDTAAMRVQAADVARAVRADAEQRGFSVLAIFAYEVDPRTAPVTLVRKWGFPFERTPTGEWRAVTAAARP